MKKMRRRHRLGMVSLALLATFGWGCQTWVPEAGLTLPSGRYLEHPPQYIPPSPPFPLPRELASQQATWAQPVVPGGVGPAHLPPPVVPQAGPAGPAARPDMIPPALAPGARP